MSDQGNASPGYVAKMKLQLQLTDAMVPDYGSTGILNVSDDYWTQRIYRTTPGVGSLDYCKHICSLEYPRCGMYILEDHFCHFGDQNQTDGTMSPSTSGPWDIYPSQGLKIFEMSW